MRILFKTFLLFLIVCLFSTITFGQKRTTRNTTTTTQKFKPPKLVTSLGSFADSVNMTTEQAETIIGLPLKIYDLKKVEYSLSSYHFLYRRRVVTEDEQTGKVSPASSTTSSLFKITPLPALWVDEVRENLKPGEELFFFDVIAKDAQGRVMYAPNLKIITQ